MHVVREETLVVEDVREALGAGGNGHGLVVAVVVHLDDGIELLGQGVAVGGETNDGENNASASLLGTFAADAEELGGVAGVDVVAGGVAGVACHDGEVGARDSERAATVVGVTRVWVRAWLDGEDAMGCIRVEASMLARP